MQEPLQQELSGAERLAWLRLIRSENVGPVTFRQLLRRYGTAEQALEALPSLARRGGRRGHLRIYPAPEAADEIAALERIGGGLLAFAESRFPPALAALDDSPPLLAYLGQAELANRSAVAVVGARNASANGRRLAETLAGQLADRGYLVVSGMARGIDAAAHRGALAQGTAAVLAGGVDVVYPPEHQELYQAIRAGGLLVSEMPLGTRPQARHFPRRNRIISGIGLGTLIVEAAHKSGSLITARYALDQGREVMAVPGSPLDPRARGCNELIRQGAPLIQSVDDVLEVLSPLLRQPLAEPGQAEIEVAPPAAAGESEVEMAQQDVIELLGATPVTVDELIRQCQLSPAVVTMALLELELAGRLERHPGNRVALLPGPAETFE